MEGNSLFILPTRKYVDKARSVIPEADPFVN